MPSGTETPVLGVNGMEMHRRGGLKSILNSIDIAIPEETWGIINLKSCIRSRTPAESQRVAAGSRTPARKTVERDQSRMRRSWGHNPEIIAWSSGYTLAAAGLGQSNTVPRALHPVRDPGCFG